MNKHLKYRLAHPEKVKEFKRKWYLKNKERLNQKRRERYLLNKDKENQQSKDWYSQNRDKRKIYTAQYRANNRQLFINLKDEERFGGNKQRVFERDDRRCQLCGSAKSRNDKPLIVHHIDGSGNRPNVDNRMSNLITLCNRCHHHTHRYQKANDFVCESREDIVRTMAKVIEDYRKVNSVPRNWNSNK